MDSYLPPSLLVSLVILGLTSLGHALYLDNFYPFGTQHGDTKLQNDKDGISTLVNLSSPVNFLDGHYDGLYVNLEGIISFEQPMRQFSKKHAASKTTKLFFPGQKTIMPFYVDTNKSKKNEILFRETKEEALLSLVTIELRAAFPTEKRFQATNLFIATWLTFQNINQANTNNTSFQVVLASNEYKTFAIFYYKNLPETEENNFAEAGFSFGDKLRYRLPGSGTKNVYLLNESSNVNFPGKWIYLIGSQHTRQQNILSADSHGSGRENQENNSIIENNGCYLIDNFTSYHNYPRPNANTSHKCNIICGLAGFPVALFHHVDGCVCTDNDILSSANRRWYNEKCNGNNLFKMHRTSRIMMGDEATHEDRTDANICTGCSKNARCGTPSHCCVCNKGFHGNGQACLPVSESSHMVGNMSGKVNDIDITGITFSVYADLTSETIYVTLLSTPESLGWLLRVMMPIATTTGFLFARPFLSLRNGFEIVGSRFVRRARVTFDTGEICYIRGEINGQDDQGFFHFTQTLSGNIPKFDENFPIEFYDYIHTYRYNKRGLLSGFFRTLFSVDEVEHKMSVVELFEFDEVDGCLDIGNFKMAVSGQRSAFEDGIVVRFELVASMGDGDYELCGEKSRRCHRFAQCIKKDGLEFCSCNVGFNGDGYQCSDIDECSLKIDDCSLSASCTNTAGSFLCTCHNGYQGNGKNCYYEERLCGDESKKCGVNSECIISRTGVQTCECMLGFSLQGESCQDVNECLWDTHDCSLNAECLNNNGSYTCLCFTGYEGDGRTCEIGGVGSGIGCFVDKECGVNAECSEGSCQCLSGYLSNGSICVDADECELGIHTCDKNAGCSNNVGSFTCTCKEGYSGDGYKCVYQDPKLKGCYGVQCDPNGTCIRNGKAPTCVCNDGYYGDGEHCKDIDECRGKRKQCHYDAICENTPGSFICKCKAGYKGDGIQCDYVDPCKTKKCGSNARCYVRQRFPVCLCKSGFYGRDPNCKDFNECKSTHKQCDSNARCVNVIGSYKCFCLAGYMGDGFSCHSDGSCGGSKCHENAKCVETNGTKSCRCISGFVGSGLVCSDFNECKNGAVKCPKFSHCFNTRGSSQCRCNMGYRNVDGKCQAICSCLNGGTCVGAQCVCRKGYSGERCQWVGDEFVIFSQGSTIQRTSLPPRQQAVGVLFSIPGNMTGLIVALDYDHKNKYIYFTDVAGKAIWRVRFNGTGAEKIITKGLSSPEGIAVDYLVGNIYWTDSVLDRIEVAKVDGSNRKVLFQTRMFNPRSIVVDPERGVMYWADWNRASPKIEMANMDGSSRRMLFHKTIALPNGLTIDKRNNELCWSDASHESISCAIMDNGKPEVIYIAARYSFGLTSFGKYFIWTEWSRRAINWYDRLQFRLMPAIKSVKGSHGLFYGIKAVFAPQETSGNDCATDNGGCSNLCLSRPGGKTCTCPTGFYLVNRNDNTKNMTGSGSGSGQGFGSGQGSGSAQGSGGSGSGFGKEVGSEAPSSIASTINSISSSSTEQVCVENKKYKIVTPNKL